MFWEFIGNDSLNTVLTSIKKIKLEFIDLVYSLFVKLFLSKYVNIDKFDFVY